ncbi:relaxase domain-containing protein [Mycolicibacterium frederiksbergense]|uniref:relaxase domain-containing protein n=1 Tax=Mycolicibacterium frederiksbergense TaxID=117567 RepID=UPI00235259E5|nr:relaxase domain-containing protein [Mycolicibacterium frederiksbergense]
MRQVAAADSTERGRSTLADYYSAKGEAPGQWMGRGLTALSDTGRCEVSAQAREQIWTVEAGSGVSEEQMRALYGRVYTPTLSASRTTSPGEVSVHNGRRACWGASSSSATASRSSPAAWRWATATTTPKRASTGTPPSPRMSAPGSAPVWP